MQLRYIFLCLVLFAAVSYGLRAQDAPTDPLTIIEQARADQSSDLVLIARGLDELPAELFTLTWLKTLSMGNDSVWIPLDNYPMGQDNTYTRIPPEIANLQQLEALEIDGGSVSEIAPEFGQLRNLETLILKDLQIEHLPPEIGDLENLRSLSLRGNLLTELPDEFAGLTKLEHLDLGRNQLTDIPPQLWELPALQSVNLDNNAISAAEFDSFDSYLKNRNNIPPVWIAIALVGAGVVVAGVTVFRRRYSQRGRPNPQ